MKHGRAAVVSNWSGDVQFSPAKVASPTDERQLKQIIDRAREQGQTVRAIGAAHSCAPIAETNHIVIRSHHFTGLHHHDASKNLATVGAGIYYEDSQPVGPYKIELAKTSVRHIRFNDLVDPLPIPLDTSYAAVIESNLPIVVQFTRVDTRNGNFSTFSTMAFPVDD